MKKSSGTPRSFTVWVEKRTVLEEQMLSYRSADLLHTVTWILQREPHKWCLTTRPDMEAAVTYCFSMGSPKNRATASVDLPCLAQ